jgi:RNA polymerase sigma factor (sigma-70 family)
MRPPLRRSSRVNRHALVRHCARILGDADAEEAVQEALLKAHNALIAGHQIRSLSAWLRTIAHNTAVNMVRARPATLHLSEVECECGELTVDAVEQRQNLRAVLEVLQALPDRQRNAIVMRELEGRSYEEIGSRLGTSHGAVRQLLNRARTAVRERIGGIAALEPLSRWLGGTGGVTGARLGVMSGGCAVAIKVCSVALLPAVVGGVAVGELGSSSQHAGVGAVSSHGPSGGGSGVGRSLLSGAGASAGSIAGFSGSNTGLGSSAGTSSSTATTAGASAPAHRGQASAGSSGPPAGASWQGQPSAWSPGSGSGSRHPQGAGGQRPGPARQGFSGPGVHSGFAPGGGSGSSVPERGRVNSRAFVDRGRLPVPGRREPAAGR